MLEEQAHFKKGHNPSFYILSHSLCTIILKVGAINSERLTALSNSYTNNNKERERCFCALAIPYETCGGVEVEVHTVLTPRDKHSLANAEGWKLTPAYAYCKSHYEQTYFFSVRGREVVEGNSLAPSISLFKYLESSKICPQNLSKNLGATAKF
jgi:hypothetical protein